MANWSHGFVATHRRCDYEERNIPFSAPSVRTVAYLAAFGSDSDKDLY